MRLAARAELTLDRDAFITVEAGAPITSEYESWLAAHPGPYQIVAPGFIPAAYTNPIYVDANADGVWTPPGL